MLTQSELDKIRAIFRDELARTKRRSAHNSPQSTTKDPWLNLLGPAKLPHRTDREGARYVTHGDAAEALGVLPARLHDVTGRLARALEALGYRKGRRLRPDGYRGPYVTPYYLPAG